MYRIGSKFGFMGMLHWLDLKLNGGIVTDTCIFVRIKVLHILDSYVYCFGKNCIWMNIHLLEHWKSTILVV